MDGIMAPPPRIPATAGYQQGVTTVNPLERSPSGAASTHPGTMPPGPATPNAPPATNRGALTPLAPTRLLVDWLAFTAPSGTTLEELLPVAVPVEWVEMPHGMMGYRRGVRAGHITVLSGGAVEGMGVHVVISGQGCRELEAWGLSSWWAYLAAIVDAGWKVSRLDYALDDRAGQLDMDRIVEAVRAGEYTSPASKWSVIQSGRKAGELSGRTVTIGSRTSDAMVRVYDKAAEQGEEDAGPWVRVELQLRNERATEAAKQHAAARDDAGPLVSGLIRRYLDFKVPDSAITRKERQPTADWWLCFLGGAAKVRLSIQPVVRTLENVLGWLDRQVAPSLALVLAAAGGDLAGLVDLVERGRERWTAEHRWMLEWSGWAPKHPCVTIA